MKRHFKLYCLLILLISFYSQSTYATHLYGGDMNYTHISGNTYEVTLTLYSDCSGAAFPRLLSSTPTVRVFKNTVLQQELILSENTSLRKEVSPVCPEQKDSTNCKIPNSPLPGVTMFVFTAQVQMPPSAGWQLRFEGALSLDGTHSAGRSGSITNINFNGSGSLMTLVSTLNNSAGHNSAPKFTTIPTPFYCLNVPQQYSPGSIDVDGDSLTFSLSSALVPGGGNAIYVNPYNGSEPLQVAGNLNFNKNNGQTSFTPNAVQRSIVVNKVQEYRDGILIGSTMREMTFVVLDNCNNTPPDGKVDSNKISGGALINEYELIACNNTDTLRLDIPVKDNDSDNISVTLNNLPSGADAQVIGNNGPSPLIRLKWAIQGVQQDDYSIYATLKDDACPLSSNSTVTYTIKLTKPNVVTREIIKPTNCKHQEYTQLNIVDGLLPRNIIIRDKNGDTTHNLSDTTGVLADSFKVGSYFVSVASPPLPCITDFTFTVEDRGVYPDTPSVDDINVCIGDNVINIIADTIPGTTINWYDNEGIRLPGPPKYNTDKASQETYYISQTFKVCESEKDRFDITVHNPPEISILNQPERVCIGEGLFLEAEGGVRYEWQPAHRVIDLQGKPFTYLTEPTMYVVTGYSQYNCVSKDTILYNDIEQCCKFAYPDAFTPNNDGVNDGWKPLQYGYVQEYQLAIYNRWGQRVFITSDPYTQWDGTYNGNTCDVGTYHYTFKARCVTGKDEINKGSFILIR